MAGQTWQLDSEGGHLANPPLSAQLRHATQPMLQFRQVVRVEPGFGKNKGDTLDFNKVGNVQTKGGKFSEQEKIPETKVLLKKGSLVMDQYGNSIPWTGKLETLSEFDPRDPIQQALKNDQAKVIDETIATEAKTGNLIYIPTGPATGVFDTDGTPSTASVGNITTFHIKEIIDAMATGIFGATTLRPVPKFANGKYLCIASRKFLRGIKDDPDWVNASQYAQPQKLLSGEVGEYYEVKFLEETYTTSLSNGVGGGSALGEAIFFGFDAIIEGVAVPEELRAKIPGNYGLDKGIAWYFLGGWKRTWDSSIDGEERIVRVTSS